MPWRDSEGRVVGGSYESWIDRQIRAAEDRGEFDDLPGSGEPLKHIGTPDDPDWWIKQKINRENLDMTGALPPQLALRKEAQHLPDRVLEQPTEDAVRALVDDYNVRVRDCWRQPLEGPPVPVRTIDPDAMAAHWRSHRTTDPEPAMTASQRPAGPPARRFRWLDQVLRRRPSAP